MRLSDQIPEYVGSVNSIAIRWRQTISRCSLCAEEVCYLSKRVRLTSIVGQVHPLNRNWAKQVGHSDSANLKIMSLFYN
jgi:hypothetical protein